MSEPFLAQINVFSFSFAPKNWTQCLGQLLPINQNQALFSLLGTSFGGDGRVNFGLPDLRGRVAVGAMFGQTAWGEKGGEATHTINAPETPMHSHVWKASSVAGNINTAAGNVPAGQQLYTAPANPGAMNPGTISTVGGSQPHENMQPYLVLNFCISLQGIFPSQN